MTQNLGASTIVAGIDPRYYYLTLGLIAMVTIIGIFIAMRWQREVNEEMTPTTPKDLYGPLEKAYYSGLMDEAEFLRIKESMRKNLVEDEPAPKPTGKKKNVDSWIEPTGSSGGFSG